MEQLPAPELARILGRKECLLLTDSFFSIIIGFSIFILLLLLLAAVEMFQIDAPHNLSGFCAGVVPELETLLRLCLGTDPPTEKKKIRSGFSLWFAAEEGAAAAVAAVAAPVQMESKVLSSDFRSRFRPTPTPFYFLLPWSDWDCVGGGSRTTSPINSPWPICVAIPV